MRSTSPHAIRWPLGLLGMVAIVAAVESAIAARDVQLGTMFTIEWRMANKAARKRAVAADVLCFGTSQTAMGLSPLILEGRTGRPAYSLALSGSQPYATYTMLRHALDAGARPKAIVVEFKWTSIASDPEWNEGILPEVASLAECARLAIDLRDASFFARLALVAGLPSYRCRPQIRERIVATVQGAKPAAAVLERAFVRNIRVNKGGHHNPASPFDGAIEAASPLLFPADWRCHPASARYIEAFLDLAESRSIPVFWLIPPVAPAARARLEEVGSAGRYAEFVRSVVARHRNLAVLDAGGADFPVAAFMDPTHLNRVGAADLSDAVAAAIAPTLAGGAPPGGWVALRPFAGGRGHEAIEDVAGSIQHNLAVERAMYAARRAAAVPKQEALR